MIQIVRAIGVSLIAALTIAAQSQEGLGEVYLGKKIRPYMIVFERFRIKEVGHVGFKAKELGHVSGKAEIVGISKGREYIVNIEQTLFLRSSRGKVEKLSREQGLKLLRPGAKLGIEGLMNPATGAIRAVRARIR